VTEPRPHSLWSVPFEPRPPLDGDTQADVVIVGGGLAGLWTAYYVLDADPGSRVVVIDRAVAGTGASAQGPGWCSPGAVLSTPGAGRAHEGTAGWRAALRDAVIEVGGVVAVEGIACDFAFDGALAVATPPAQLARARAAALLAADSGDVIDALRPDAVPGLLDGSVLGAFVDPHSARVHPGRLARGLVSVVSGLGATLVDSTTALRLSPRAVVTDRGTVRARHVVRTTGAATPGLVTARSVLLASAPVPDAAWARTGLDAVQAVTDLGHAPVRVVRTADRRLVVSHMAPGGSTSPSTREVAHLRGVLSRWLPGVGAAQELTHAWTRTTATGPDGGPLVGWDEHTGMAHAVGFGDDDVAGTNLAGRILADLVTGEDSPLVELADVGHDAFDAGTRRAALRSRARVVVAAAADAEERLTGRPSLVARALRQA
jgi:glycine/D-amino acid oxidase-like deaminating enzyme